MSYSTIKQCRICRGEQFKEIHHSSDLPIAGIYTAQDQPVSLSSPITLLQCQKCNLIQLRETIHPSIYEEYHFVGNSSTTYENYLKEVTTLLCQGGLQEKDVFEIGASNGVLLRYLQEYGSNKVTGIEPSSKLCEDAKQLGVFLDKGFFTQEYVDQHEQKYDCVIIRHVLEHLEHLDEIVILMKSMLKPGGIIVAEVPSLNTMIQSRNFSNIFHEHLNYFSEETLNYLFQKINFTPQILKNVDIHGGAIFAIYRDSADSGTNRIPQVSNEEIVQFFEEMGNYYHEIHNRISTLVEQRKVLHGFGASHRTFNLLARSHLNSQHIPYIYDNNPFLHGKILNGLNNIVLSPSNIEEKNPDVIVLFATSYEKEIRDELMTRYHFRGEIISLKHGV